MTVIEDSRSHHCKDGGNAELHYVVACFADMSTTVRAARVDVVDSQRQEFQETVDRNYYLRHVDIADDSRNSNNAVMAGTDSAVGVAVVAADAEKIDRI